MDYRKIQLTRKLYHTVINKQNANSFRLALEYILLSDFVNTIIDPILDIKAIFNLLVICENNISIVVNSMKWTKVESAIPV